MIFTKAAAVIVAAFMAITVHALMPSELSVEAFDSAFVSLVGFQAVAVFYFLLLFFHCTLIVQTFSRQSSIPSLSKGLRFGCAFALLYFFGMQEIVVEASPFEQWGLPFVTFQLFLGLGDAIPTVMLCTVIVYCTAGSRPGKKASEIPFKSWLDQFKAIALIAAAFLLIRTFGYETGIINSNVDTYPMQVYIWTVVFGIALGWSYVLLSPFYYEESKKFMITFRLAFLSIGLNWMIYNSFIGMIFSDTMAQMLLRSGLDVLALCAASLVITRLLVRGESASSLREV